MDSVDRHGQGAPLPQQVAQRAAVDQLHDQEDQVAVAALVEHRDDAGVPEPGRDARLPLEAAQERRVRDVLRAHHLDGDRPVQPEVDAAVDRGHAAAGDETAQPVPAVEHSAARQAGERVHDRRV